MNKLNKLYSKIYMFFVMFLVVLLLVVSPKTNAKFLVTNFETLWENIFTKFTQLDSVFYIEESKGGTQTELWGGVKNGTTGAGTINKHHDGSDFYSFGNYTGSGYKQITETQIKSNYGDYLIEKMKNLEFNVVNHSEERMVVCFKLYYYAPKYEDVSTHISFGLYNTILSADDSNKVLKGEISVNQADDDYTNGQYSNIVEVPSIRLSGNPGGQFNTEVWVSYIARGDFYYPHRVDINPYQILFDSKKYNIKTADYHTDEPNTSGNPVTYKYPAHDYNSSSPNYAFNIMPRVDLEDFILDVDETASFNLSLYFGDYGSENAQGNSVSFVTSLSIEAVPESQILAEIASLGGQI